MDESSPRRFISVCAHLNDQETWSLLTRRSFTDVLDGAMIVLATYTLNIFHPGRLLYAESPVQIDVTEVSDKDNSKV